LLVNHFSKISTTYLKSGVYFLSFNIWLKYSYKLLIIFPDSNEKGRFTLTVVVAVLGSILVLTIIVFLSMFYIHSKRVKRQIEELVEDHRRVEREKYDQSGKLLLGKP
jgi:hypothetical protein